MNVVDLPNAGSRALCEEAAGRYADRISSRAAAVYRVGSARFPELLGVSVLAVVDRPGIDNRYFYSPDHRMPRRYAELFIDEPYILPVWSMRVMQHTAHYSVSLLAGRDPLAAYRPNDEPDERWCRLIEMYCTQKSFADRVRESGVLSGRRIFGAANALRHALADASAVSLDVPCKDYAARIDALFEGYEARKQPEESVHEAWRAFGEALAAIEGSLQARFCRPGDSVFEVSRSLMRGDGESEAFDREYAFRRAVAIDGYHKDLSALGLPYGHLFYEDAHPEAVRKPREPFAGGIMRNLYLVRRRFQEYAGA